MNRTISIVGLAVAGVVVIAALVALGFAAAAAAESNRIPTGLTASGEGRVQAAPDVAKITIGVTTQAATAQEALQQNSTLTERVLQAIKAQGIAEKDLQTQGLSVQPVETRPRDPATPPQIAAYRATNTIQVTVRDLSGNKVGQVVDAANQAGANVTGGIQFSLENDTQARQEALKRAIEAARAKAEAMASASGRRLGSVRAISESGVSVPVLQRGIAASAEAAQAAPAPPVQAGELTVTARVTVIWD